MSHRLVVIALALLAALLLNVSPAVAAPPPSWHAPGWTGYYPYASTWNYPYRVYGYGPYALGNPAAAGYASYYFPPESPTEQDMQPADYAAGPQDNEAHLLVRVPENAELWFDGKATQQRGPEREFHSPPLTPGQSYHYDVRLRWTENGKSMEAKRTIHVHANDWQEVDLTQPATAK